MIPALTLLVALGSSLRASAQGTLPEELTRVAKGIQKLLAGRDDDRISVGDFRGPARYDNNYGPGIQERLAAQLHALKVRVDRKAPTTVTGEYLVVEDKHVKDLIAVRLIARVYDKNGEVLTTLQADLRGTNDVGQILAPTVSLPVNGDRKTRNEELKKHLDKPSVHIKGTRISASPDSPYSVEVLVKTKAHDKARPRAPRIEGGQAYVDLRRDELYELRLHNASKHDAAITIHIDGLDVFTFSDVRDPKTGRPKYRYYIVVPKYPFDVVGWHKRNEPPNNFLSFLVTAYGKGASAYAPEKAVGKTGTITLTFAMAWTGKTPEEEKYARDAGGNETGFGPPVSRRINELQRQIGVVRDIVTIRYSR
jgi:hypothetical protein